MAQGMVFLRAFEIGANTGIIGEAKNKSAAPLNFGTRKARKGTAQQSCTRSR
jgi:hypothetical protein